jgi:uncharacterized protein (TIGR02145 family)
MKLKSLLLTVLATLGFSVATMAQNVVKDIDGNTYPTIIIGSQEWMASDLKTTRYSNGDSILNGQNVNTWLSAAASKTGAYCILKNDTSYANKRGKIYNGHILYENRNVCPSGWRVPKDSDFIMLEAFIGMPSKELYNQGTRGSTQMVGVKLKSKGRLQLGTGLWDLSSTPSGTDLFGWNGYPHGARLASGNFCCDNGSVGYLSKDSINSGVLRRELSFNVDGIIRVGEPMSNGHQIRCIKESCVSIVYDTIRVKVTDTLVINANLTGLNPPNNLNTIRIFPNPASTHITIEYGNFKAMSGYTLKIVNAVGQIVFTTPINQQTSYINLSTWTGNGIYFVQVIDLQNNTIENRKIVIQ